MNTGYLLWTSKLGQCLVWIGPYACWLYLQDAVEMRACHGEWSTEDQRALASTVKHHRNHTIVRCAVPNWKVRETRLRLLSNKLVTSPVLLLHLQMRVFFKRKRILSNPRKFKPGPISESKTECEFLHILMVFIIIWSERLFQSQSDLVNGNTL